MTIEELQDLNRDFPAVVESVAELRSDELALRGRSRDFPDGLHDLGNRSTQEEMIMGNLVDFAHSADEFEEAADLRLRHEQETGDITHTRGPEPFGAAEE